jgi:hypothetical protein
MSWRETMGLSAAWVPVPVRGPERTPQPLSPIFPQSPQIPTEGSSEDIGNIGDRVAPPRERPLSLAVAHPPGPAPQAILTQPEPPPLTPGDLADIEEAVEERAAIREFDAGEPKAVAEQEARAAMRAFQVLVDMGQGQPARWVTMIAPGCDLAQAREAALWRFPGRVLEVLGREVRP